MYTTAELGFCTLNRTCCWEGFELYCGTLTEENERAVWDKVTVRDAVQVMKLTREVNEDVSSHLHVH